MIHEAGRDHLAIGAQGLRLGLPDLCVAKQAWNEDDGGEVAHGVSGGDPASVYRCGVAESYQIGAVGGAPLPPLSALTWSI